MTKSQIVKKVLTELDVDSHRTRQLIERYYNDLKKDYVDDDLVYAILEKLSS